MSRSATGSIDDFVMRMNRLITSLRELSEEMEDSRVVRKILHMIPKKLRQVGIAIEMLADLNTIPWSSSSTSCVWQWLPTPKML
jgi:hypothetical protein